jgi:hypothetical protein
VKETRTQTVTMAHALGALSELQAVAAGRMRAAAGAVVVVDDSTAAVLRADGKLLGSILHAGALRVAALEDVPGELPETEAGAVEYVVVVCDLSERVLKACEALQAGGGRVRSVLLTAPSCAKRCAEGELRLSGGSVAVSWLPLFFAPFVCLPQPTVMLSGAQLTAQHVSGRAAAPDELGALAYQACVMMEGLSGSKYQVFAVGSRPRALAMAMKDWTNPVREAVAGGQWRDESQIEPAHLLILDGDADLVSAGRHGDDNAGALLDFIFWNDIFVSGGPPQAAPGISSMCQPEAWGSGDTTKRPLRPRGAGNRRGWELLCTDDGGARQLLRGLCQCGRADGRRLVEQSLRDAIAGCADAPTDDSNLSLHVCLSLACALHIPFIRYA